METYEDIIENRVDLLLAIPKWLFNVTLAFGTSLFLFALTVIDTEFLLPIGFFFVVIAAVINTVTFCLLIAFSFVYRYYQRSLITGSLILLANFPVAYVYIVIINIFHNSGVI